MFLMVVVEKLYLHRCHVDPSWTFPLTALTAHTEIHGLVHGI